MNKSSIWKLWALITATSICVINEHMTGKAGRNTEKKARKSSKTEKRCKCYRLEDMLIGYIFNFFVWGEELAFNLK